MTIPTSKCVRTALAILVLAAAGMVGAADIGRIKITKGVVNVDRDGSTLPAAVGMRLRASDVIRTGSDGAVGITMDDDSLLSAGPDSTLSLDRFAFDPTTNQGKFDASLNKGTLAVISGRIAKQSPDAMTVRTPALILGVRGTTFAVNVND